jgi:hypothetical protein
MIGAVVKPAEDRAWDDGGRGYYGRYNKYGGRNLVVRREDDDDDSQ